MDWKPIEKPKIQGTVLPNLLNYEETCSTFSWDKIANELKSVSDRQGINIADIAIDRHATGTNGDQLAMRFIGKDWTIIDFSYNQLKAESNRFANVLQSLGVAKGDRVFVLAGRIPALYIAALGTLKNGSVFCPMFSAFGPEPIYQRMERGDAKVLITTKLLYKQKVDTLRSRLPKLQYILLADAEEDVDEGLLSLPRLMKAAAEEFSTVATEPEDMALLHFTSGTTGMPKGAIHVHQAVYMHYMTAKYVLDLHPDDIYWCTADPGWVTGTSYGIIAPLTHGITSIIDEAEFDADRWYRILETQKVSVWYTAPTAIRRLMRMDIEPRQQYDLSHLRLVCSVGEPLNPEAVVWGLEKLGLPIHDNWWQTETGGIAIANYDSMDIRPGSMGRPLPSIEAAIIRRHEDGTLEVIDKPNMDGDLALRPNWPSMFRDYLHDEARYRKCFVGGWYITGDLAMRDEDGYFWFVGREDDIIKTSGHMVGPFEVESALMEHPAVAEAGVIGKPNPTIGELVKAFVSLKPSHQPSESLRLELIGFARQKLGSAIAPKELEFQDNLPKTRSGKIMRRLLKARELGLPEGDLSTLETN
ncbi:MAG: acetate--CoA ligase [Pseudanabaena sp. M57BS1SP1A06MG]|nr:acetate--CoA ligase [Pseudanabaena sp. M53BS1SP1A06MG]MCA6583577.1 acetate--CoA ligase [Pseudanabaena sp. M34BS1SP1A06MG]MCA6593616.1 acetate--CoA ligase [Pseudanabaena sp. M38BS1SP1A06MG]MCA6599320.1 acetate--CoA ligase [Pseudanabaena sp. M57BS1SP1A06MG]